MLFQRAKARKGIKTQLSRGSDQVGGVSPKPHPVTACGFGSDRARRYSDATKALLHGHDRVDPTKKPREQRSKMP